MEFMPPLSSLNIVLSIIAILFAVILFTFDKRRSDHQKHLRILMRSYVATNAMQSFSVITNITADDQSIAPLVSELEKQQYSKLQLIVLVAAEVTNRTVNELRKLQRKNQSSLQMRIVRRTPRSDETKLIRRYANSETLIWLNYSDTLTDDFFTRMSFELIDESVTAISPREVGKIDDTLHSASRALQNVARQTVQALVHNGDVKPLVIRRSAYLPDGVTKPLHVEHSAITVKEVTFKQLGVRLELLLLLSIAATTAASYYFINSGWYIIPLSLACVFTLIMALRLVTYPYSFWNKLALCLLIPLWPITAIIFALLSLIKQYWTKLRNRKSDVAVQPQ